MTNWDEELKKIDRQLESISDKALIPSAPAPRAAPTVGRETIASVHGEQQRVLAERAATRTWPAFLRLSLASALGIGILFWPYPKDCGMELYGYLAAVAAVIAGGLWSSVWTWHHRTARAHILSLLLVVWGFVLGASEVLPRAGYQKQGAMRRAGFACTVPVTPVVRP
jgi:hypothetical protein